MATTAVRQQPRRGVPRLVAGRLATIAGNSAFVISGIWLQLLPLLVLSLPLWFKRQHWVASALIALVLLISVRGVLTAAQRHRFWSLLGVDIPRTPAIRRPLLRRLAAAVSSESTWRQFAYHLLAGPILAVGGLAVLGLLGAGLGLSCVWAYAWAFPPHSALRFSGALSQHYLTKPATYYLIAVGLAMLLAAPAVAGIVTRIDVRVAKALLGPSRHRELEQQVESLSESRSAAVLAADAERRRIERDLHDGAQQRLVSLAMNLGMARASLTDLPEQARRVIADAHDEAKEALTELRDLVRGLHPAVLDDRGLDAALSGIAARAPLPVKLTVRVTDRVSPTVEAVAYFVVSEALANIARHARASRAEVDVRRTGSQLVLTITDDGVGGADPARGSGLAGLAQRARSVDGKLQIDSPVGGPTTITAELPCAS